jgi:hypothetical protein
MQEIAEAILRVVGELVIEVIIKGPGYLIVRISRPKDKTDPDGCLVTLVGLAFWCAVCILGWAVS